MPITADLRHALRAIARAPLLSAVVVVSLALGIGVNTVVFSWIQSRVLRPIPGAPRGGEVLLVEPVTEDGHYPGASWPEYLDLRDGLASFATLFAARPVPLYAGEAGAVERLSGLLVSGNYFSALEVRPAAGRFFTAGDLARSDGEPVVVISHGVWQSRFDGRADAVGRTMRINGRPVMIAGVAPPEFQGTTAGLQFDAWLPATLAPVVANGSPELTDRTIRGYSVMGRLGEGTSRAGARAEVLAVGQRLQDAWPEASLGVRHEILPFHDSPRGPQRMLNTALGILQGLMLLVLAAVCGNVATLMLARAAARRKDVGLRLSLGASRWRVASLLLAENLLLATAGAVLGALLAVWGTRALLVVPLTGLPLRFQTSIDGTGLLVAVVLGLGSGLLFGLAPALQLARLDPQRVLRGAAGGGGGSRLRHVLMAAQAALALLVLLVAGIFFRSMLESRTDETGFTRDGVALAAFDLSGRDADDDFARGLAARLLERIRLLPGVEGAAIASTVPLDVHGLPSRGFTIEGQARAGDARDEALANTVTPGYFAVMRIPLVAGADFSPLTDRAAPREAIVNEEFIRRYLAGGAALGRRLSARGGTWTIVGVAGTSLYNAFGERPTPLIYYAWKDAPLTRGEIHVRADRTDPLQAMAGVERAAREVDAELPVFNVRTLHDHVDTNLVLRRVPARMFSVLGPLLLALAAIGIYAVVSHTVALRTREIGIRMAIGATATRVMRAMVRDTLAAAAAGGAAGWVLALGVALHLAPGRTADPVVFTLAPALLLAVAVAASWIPARRAAAVDPTVALRAE